MRSSSLFDSSSNVLYTPQDVQFETKDGRALVKSASEMCCFLRAFKFAECRSMAAVVPPACLTVRLISPKDGKVWDRSTCISRRRVGRCAEFCPFYELRRFLRLQFSGSRCTRSPTCRRLMLTVRQCRPNWLML